MVECFKCFKGNVVEDISSRDVVGWFVSRITSPEINNVFWKGNNSSKMKQRISSALNVHFI